MEDRSVSGWAGSADRSFGHLTYLYFMILFYIDYLAHSPDRGCLEILRNVEEGVEDKIRNLFSSNAPYSTIIHSKCVPEHFLLREVRQFMYIYFLFMLKSV